MIFRPIYTIDTIYHLDPTGLRRMGIKAVFSDLDNTLLAWNIRESSQEMAILNKKLAKAGIKLIVISNNNPDRVSAAVSKFNVAFWANARKPLPFGILKALKHYNLSKEDVIMVGDQLITDIQAGNLAGVKTVLVKPLVETDKWNTRINRFFEKIIFFFLNINKKIEFKESLKWMKN